MSRVGVEALVDGAVTVVVDSPLHSSRSRHPAGRRRTPDPDPKSSAMPSRHGTGVAGHGAVLRLTGVERGLGRRSTQKGSTVAARSEEEQGTEQAAVWSPIALVQPEHRVARGGIGSSDAIRLRARTDRGGG
jgi:hypothetical protein